jgi:ankyrin repeat protein
MLCASNCKVVLQYKSCLTTAEQLLILCSFLQDEPVLPKQLEHVHLTRLCFSQLSLASHAFNIGTETIRRNIVRGEYAFTEYSVIHAFDHLLDVLSEENKIASSECAALRVNLRKFVTSRVNAPEKAVTSQKHVDKRLAIFKDDNFYNSLKHAIIYHEDQIEKDCTEIQVEETEGEPILALLKQFMHTRSVLEKMVTSAVPLSLDTLYGTDLFKCSVLRCESFHDGFSTSKIRDSHLARHERMYFCSMSGCSAAMIGFSTSASLKKHEQDYHNGGYTEKTFPWHGKLEDINIVQEIKNGNQLAFELWLSEWNGSTTQYSYDDDPIVATVRYGRNKMMEALLNKIGPEKPGFSSWSRTDCCKLAITAGNEDGTRILLKHVSNLSDKMVYSLLTKALKLQNDQIAKEIFAHPSSTSNDLKEARKSSYLNLSVRFGRYEVFQHILEVYKASPSTEDDKGRTSLIAAAEFDQTRIASYLVESANCDKWAGNKKGDTPLTMAGRQGNSAFISSIYHEEISQDSVHQWLKAAQLRNATCDGDDGKVTELLNDDMWRVDEVDTDSRSPWLCAVERGYERIVMAFLARTDIKFERRLRVGLADRYDERRPGALHLAASSSNESLMQLLLHSGKFDTEIDRSCGYLGKKLNNNFLRGTPLEIAEIYKHEDMKRVLEQYKNSLENKDN